MHCSAVKMCPNFSIQTSCLYALKVLSQFCYCHRTKLLSARCFFFFPSEMDMGCWRAKSRTDMYEQVRWQKQTSKKNLQFVIQHLLVAKPLLTDFLLISAYTFQCVQGKASMFSFKSKGYHFTDLKCVQFIKYPYFGGDTIFVVDRHLLSNVMCFFLLFFFIVSHHNAARCY